MFRFVRNPDPRKKPPYGSRIDPTHPLAQGLVGCWLMNEGGGNRLFDCTGLHGGGTFGSLPPEWTMEGLYFAGGASTQNRYIQVADSKILAGKADYTVIVDNLLKSTTVSPTGGEPIYCERASTGNNILKLVFEDSANPNKYQFILRDDAATLDRFYFNSTPSTNVFYQIAVVKRGTSIKLYVNGQLDNTGTQTGSDNYTDNNVSMIAGDPADYDNFYGVIKNVLLFDRALSNSEITQLNAEPYSFILVPQYWYMVDFGAVEGGQTASFTSSFSLSSSQTSKAHYKASISSSLGLSGAQTSLAHLQAALSSPLDLSTLIEMVAHLKGSLTTTFTLTGTFETISAATALFTSIITLNESLETKASLLAVISDTLTLGATPSALANLKGALTSTFGLSSEFSTQLIMALSATLELGTSTEALGHFLASLSDSLIATDSPEITVHYKLNLSDNLSLGEQITAAASYIMMLTDALGLSALVRDVTVTASGVVTITFNAENPGVSFSAGCPGATFSGKGPNESFS